MQAQIIPSDNGSAIIQFTYKGNHHHIPLKNILFIESSARKCFIHLADSTDETACFYGKLSDIAESLYNYGFVRCHQSYLVSITSNARYNDNQLYLNNIPIPVSEKYRKHILNIFHQTPDNLSGYNVKPTTGALVCIKGEYSGTIIKLYPNVSCSIGRDNLSSEIIINLPYISRSHCDIIYRENGSYEVTDHSHNGTYLIRDNGTIQKLSTDKISILPSGSVICFGDKSLQYRLI